MFSLSVVLPVLREHLPSRLELERFRDELEAAGRFSSIEMVLVIGNLEIPGYDGDGIRCIATLDRGMVSLAHAGLRAATGDLAVVLDPRHGYRPESVLRVLDPVISGEAEVAVGVVRTGKTREKQVPAKPDAIGSGGDDVGRVGGMLRPVLGTAAPFSGLIGLRRMAADEALSSSVVLSRQPSAGSFFVLDLVNRLPGKRVDVAVDRDHRVRVRPPVLNDVRQVKSLLDDRFGNYSRLAQFCLVGASGMIVDLSFYAFFQWMFSRPWLVSANESRFGSFWQLPAAGGLAILLAMIWNFSLNRRLTFNDAMKGNLLRQFLAYALGNALGVILSFSLRLYLPANVAFFNEHKLAAAVVGIVVATGISFSMSRWVVFSRNSTPPEAESPDPLPAP